ncbi:sensor histidine kinase [Olleya sediminilitoris]|uniref:sensor histidine kinase n=1 Tax=Olleya sediminilitoris TaxID=2795739 RepID=UPI00048BE194|nr:sensor histidine kinase [Olleya sediminilitoris]
MENNIIDGQEQVIVALVYGLIFLVLLTTGLILFFHYSRQKIIQKELEKADLKLKNQQKILQTSIAIQERERKRIAQDLHDAISSKLNIVSLTTNVLLIDETITKKQKTALEQILNITTGTLESSRKIAHDLLPPILNEFGLKAALQELFEDFSKHTKIEIEDNVETLTRLSKNNQLHVFRIVQELINNSIRHGKANELVVYMEQNETGFIIRYQDNGKGFDVNNIHKKPGIGLQNIKSRVKILKGTLKIESTPNNGSQFIIRCNYER